MNESRFEVKNLERKKAKPSIFIGSSFESLAVAEAVKDLLDPDKFEVDIWDEDIFDPGIPMPVSEYQVREKLKAKIVQHRKYLRKTGHQTEVDTAALDDFAPKNIDSLKNFTDIYDYAIFIFVPDDKIVSQSRVKSTDEQGLVGQGVRHNIIFEFGLFLGKIGARNTFVLADQDTRSFIEHFFTDLKGVKNYEYQGNYRQWIDNDDAHALPYDPESLTQQVREIQAAIERADKEVAITFLPSTSLAFGFFNSMMKLVIENLARMKEGRAIEEFKEEGAFELEFPLDRKEIVLKLVVPGQLKEASHPAYQKYVNHYGMVRVAVPTRTRPITIFCHPEVKEKSGRLIIYDIPSTLFSSWNAIEMLTQVKDIKELLNNKELNNFKKAVAFLLNKGLEEKSVSGLEHIRVEVISPSEIAADFPGVAPL